MAQDATTRFSSRVADYIRWRPSYPREILDVLQRECALAPDSVIADVGCGTGLLAELFLRHGCALYGVEPNAEMRAAGEKYLARYPRFRSINGTAESTGLPDKSVDFVTAGQSFHWFDAAAARVEFARILRPGGCVVLVWNERRATGSAFLEGYEELLRRHAPEYLKVDHRRIGREAITAFFGHSDWRETAIPNAQVLDFDGLAGRLHSSSYTPQPGVPNYDAMMHDLRLLFDSSNEGGAVTFVYDTRMYYGRLADL
jgi:SAM-dependent methyltransferase